MKGVSFIMSDLCTIPDLVDIIIERDSSPLLAFPLIPIFLGCVCSASRVSLCCNYSHAITE